MNASLHLNSLVEDLADATQAMHRAALADDWDEAREIQQQRLILAKQILECARRQELNSADAGALSEIQQLESTILERAKTHREALGNTLKEIRSSARKAKVQQIRKTYGA